MSARAVKQPPHPSTFETYVRCKDHLVSGENFDLLLDDNLDLLMTSPKPAMEALPAYYKSQKYISHTDAKKNLVDHVYQKARKYTLQQKVKLIESFHSEEKKILDVGAGTGDFLKACADKGWQVTGIEPNSKARALATKKFQNEQAVFFEDMESLKKKDGVFLGFDVIALWHVLEHVPNLDEMIFNLKKLLKPEGTLLVAVPNFKSFDATHYKTFWAAYDVPRHLWHFSQTAIRRLFFFQNMEVHQTLPMKLDAFYVALLSEQYKKSKLKFLKALWIGFLSNWKAKKTNEYSSLIFVIKNAKKWF
tara:strand:+ start:24728 stop:25642 length:915 start_codon:yes stop_codon:yes gene_type:complete